MTGRFFSQVVLVCALPAALAAEVQVNVRTSGSQANPAVAAGPAGGSIVVWSSYFTSPGRSNDILARRLDASGGFAGDEFVVNSIGAGNQTEPAVAVNAAGGFAVAWQGPGLDQDDVYLRLFDPDGRSLTDDLLVNSPTAGRQLYPSIATTDARVILAWESREVVEDVNRIRVYAGVFAPTGDCVGSVTLAAPGYDYRYPEVAADASGRFTLVWTQERSGRYSVMAQRFDPNGLALGEVSQVNVEAIASLTQPSIAMNPAGYFVITWDGDPNHAADDDIHARLYDPNAVPISEPFIVNTLRDGPQQWPQVAINDAGEFLVAWEHDTGDPNTATDIFARRFDAAGLPVADQFQLNTYTQNRQRHPDVAATGAGAFIATWESRGQDGASYGVFAHLDAAAEADPNH